MIITIDFLNKAVYIQEATKKDIPKIWAMIDAAGDDPDDYRFNSIIGSVEFENDNTAGIEVNYVTKKDIN